MFIVDEDAKKSIEGIQKGGAEIPQDILDSFKQNELVIKNDENELLKFRNRYNAARYHPEAFSLSLAPTVECNLSCEYCWQRTNQSLVEEKYQTATMSEPTLKGILLFAKQLGEKLKATHLPLSFFGGEPLMAKDLILCILQDLAQWGEEHSISLAASFDTNCTLFDQSFIEELKQYTITYARTTLDGPEKVHDQYRHYKNGKGTYEQIVAKMGQLLDSGIGVVAHININRHYKHVLELFDDLSERGLKQIEIRCEPLFDPLISFQEAQKQYGLLDESVPIPESQFAIPFKDIPEARAYIYRAAFKKGFELSSPNLALSIPCNGGKYYHYTIDPLGDVYKCIGSMLLEFLRVGHIHESGYFEQYAFLYEWMNTDPTYIEKCQCCGFLPSCGGGCITGRIVGGLPCFCEVSFFPGEEYMKMYMEQKYPEEFKSLKME